MVNSIKPPNELIFQEVHQNLKFFAEMISQFKGDHYPSEEHVFNYTVRKPLGVVA